VAVTVVVAVVVYVYQQHGRLYQAVHTIGVPRKEGNGRKSKAMTILRVELERG